MKQTKALMLILIFTAFTAVGCSGVSNYAKGSKTIKEENRNIEYFDKISLQCAAKIDISQGENNSVLIIADDNILPIIETKLSSQTLFISTKENICTDKSKIIITMKDIAGLEISGSGDISAQGLIKSESLAISISGSGDVKIPSADLNNLAVKISGSGDVKIAGTGTNSLLEIYGSGDIDLSKLITTSAAITINGSGDCKVNATENLKAEINGSGDIKYKGNPKNIKRSIIGSGNIKPMKK
jgi:hypothetical protein